MDRTWGKHGGGAPKGHDLKKYNLNNILHNPSRDVRPPAPIGYNWIYTCMGLTQ